MLDVHGQNPSSAREKRSPRANGTLLNGWIRQQVDMPYVRVKSRLRGNNLHLLLEGSPCPSGAVVLPKLRQALSVTVLADQLPPESPPVYRVIVYGRLPQCSTPEWTESFVPHAVDRPVLEAAPLETTRSPEQTRPRSLSELASSASQECNIEATGVSMLHAARQGQPEAIARHLSDVFGSLGIAVRIRQGSPKPSQPAASSSTLHPLLAPPQTRQRLFIVCESAYSPDPLLVAEPIAQRLRALELKGFQDAVIFGQVTGETKPEWLLRVDLTPHNDILKAWARWGDVQSITRLLNRILLPYQVETSALLKDATLHLTCRGMQSAKPDKLTTIAAIVPLLEALSPQGIRAAMLYGFAQDASSDLGEAASNAEHQNGTTPTPLWVHWLDLSTDPQPKTALNLAQEGNLDAIAFLLTRLLNPDLDTKLATGGIQLQVRQKADLLHVMGEAPLCPSQNQMGGAIARFLKPLQLPAIAGVRIYGRRSGQKQPLWSYGVDFASRDRLVPEATPEFAVSDAYVGDLLSPPGALVLRTEQASEASQSWFGNLWNSSIQRVQRSLLWSQLFVPLETVLPSPQLQRSYRSGLTTQRSATVAVVWGTLGLLLVVQADWLLSQWIKTPPPAPIATEIEPPTSSAPALARPFPTLSLKKSKPGDPTVFNNSGFTQPGAIASSPASAAADSSGLVAAALPASPLRPKAGSLLRGLESYPTFNSRQLDEKLALYQAYLRDYGTPDILIIGSSRALRGVDPTALQKTLAEQGYSGAKIFNFGVNGATAQVVDAIVRQLLPQDKLPKLILWADGARAFNSGRSDVTYSGIIASDGYRTLAAGRSPLPGTATAEVPTPQKLETNKTEMAAASSVAGAPATSLTGGYRTVNQKLNQRLEGLSALYSQRDNLKRFLRDGLISLVPKSPTAIALNDVIAPNNLSEATSPGAVAANSPASVLSDGQSAIDIDGFLPLPNQFNPATYYQKYARVNGDYDSDYESFNLEGSQAQALTNLVQFSQTHQIPLVFVNLPLTGDYLDPTRKRHEEAFQQYMLRLSTQLGFIYRDLNQSLTNQPAYFSDPSHLNRYGAYEVARRLAIDVMIPWNQSRR
ncbi:MAG TPA: DUF1574 domain-containing protein [Candidatus Sericytochromatia bacterium]